MKLQVFLEATQSKYYGYAGKQARTSAAMVAGPARFNAQQRGRPISSAHGASQPAGAGASRDALSLLHVGLSRYTAAHKTCSQKQPIASRL